MVERKEYLDQLEQWREEQVIKVVTGIRRCGKSTLLSQYQDRLKAGGVPAEQIVSVNFEELEYEELLDYRKLYAYLKQRLVAGQTASMSSRMWISISPAPTPICSLATWPPC